MSNSSGLRFDLVAGELALDFANTAGGARQPEKEYLLSYGDLVAWGRQAGALSAEEAAGLSREAARRPAEAAAVLRRAIALREAVYRVFAAQASAKPVAEADLGAI